MTKNQSHLKSRTINKIKQLNFDGKVISCGLDFHKTNWKINAKMEGLEVAAFSQNPDPLVLKNYTDKNYPGAELKVVYEVRTNLNDQYIYPMQFSRLICRRRKKIRREYCAGSLQ